jgi:drug/metabolite transporter (DMT)-like permease
MIPWEMLPLGQGMRHLGTALIVAATALGALGLFVYFTERGVANEIKGFVLLLIAAVLLAGGCVLRELRAIRRALENKNPN